MIKSIKANGFKSFAKPTELKFEKGFNSVVGPNGAGKSNVVDLLCFVLGRISAKSLRAEKSANLIYNGGKNGTAAKYAEGNILFDNSNKIFPLKDKEIRVTRVVKEDGTSRYSVNGETRTRQQVLELLNSGRIDPDGYNIVMQGDINQMAEMNGESRRVIIEDIAGISVYEDKKEKALRELERVEGRLKEAGIILTEREAYLRELKKDRDQALKYKELEKNIRRNKATHLHLQIKDKEDKIEKYNEQLKSNNDRINAVNKEIIELRKRIEAGKNEIEGINKDIEEKGEREQVVLHKEVEELKGNTIRHESRIEALKREIKNIASRKDGLEGSIKGIEEKVENLKKEKEELKKKNEELLSKDKEVIKKLESSKSGHDVTKIEDAIDKIDERINDAQIKIEEMQNKKTTLLREKDALEIELSSLDANLKKISSKEGVSLSELNARLKAIGTRLEKVLDESSSLSLQLERNRINLQKENEELARLRIKDINIKENIQNIGIKRLKEGNIKGIYGTIGELGKVDNKYSLALEVAAGQRINSLVVDSDKVAAECISFLKRNKVGVVTFLPLNKIKAPLISNKRIGHGLALELVKFDSRYKDVFAYVFGNTYVVDSIEEARKIGIGSYRMVGLDGDLAEISGVMIGGYRVKRAGSFKDENFEKELEESEEKIRGLREVIDILEKRRKENDNNVANFREEKAKIEAELIKYGSLGEIDVNSIKKERDVLTKKIRKNEDELNLIEESLRKVSLEELRRERQKLKNKIIETRKPEAIKEIERLEDEKEKIRENIIANQSRIKHLEIQVNEMLMPEKENMYRIIKEHEKELKEFNNELEELSEKLKNNNSVLKERERKEKELYANFKNLFVKRNKVNEGMQKLELKVNDMQNRIRSYEERVNLISIDRAKFVAEKEGLMQEFEEFKGESLRKGMEISQLKQEINEFEKMLQSMGNVNLRALEVYEEIEKEHQKLLEKANKLKDEKEDVLGMIDEVESKKTDTFLKTFNNIKRNFEKIFSELTTKGTAHLVLENEEKPLEGGASIMVKISGNKYLDIKSLSGGEKTLTALAFIFAIQESEPAHFYVFDEVDATLDKRNSELLAKLLKKYSEKAQYIVITHNDAIISEADQLYGVSMRDNGISHVVSLKV